MPTNIYFGPINKNPYCDNAGRNFVSIERDFTEGFSIHMRSAVEGDRNEVHNVVAANARGNIDQQRHAVYLYQVDGNGNLCNYDYTNTWFKQSLDKLGATPNLPTLDENITALTSNTITDPTELTKARNFCSAPFQWLKFSVKWNSDDAPIDGFIMLKKMPRAVSFLPEQQPLLNVYEKLGLISAPNNDDAIKYVGKHRTINNAAMFEMRVLDYPNLPLTHNVLKSIIDTTVTFCSQMTNDGYIVPHYGTDPIKDKAIGVMCYSASDVQAPAYREAGFMEVQDQSIEQLFPGPDASANNESAGYSNALRRENSGRLFFRNFDNNRHAALVDDTTTITTNVNTVVSSPVVRLNADAVNSNIQGIFRTTPVCRP